jgi:hypothetical protein
MSHFSVLILGDDPEMQLHPFAELTAADGPAAEDHRAEFVIDAPAGTFADTARAIIADLETGSPELVDEYRALLAGEGPEAVLRRWFGGGPGPDGDWGRYTNPSAKWDWCVLGGRFQGLLRLLPGKSGVSGQRSWTNADEPVIPGSCDQARCGDIDWPATRQQFTPFAVLKDGEWHEQGEAGWFGAVANAKDDAAWAAEADALLQDLPPATLVSVWDCHV